MSKIWSLSSPDIKPETLRPKNTTKQSVLLLVAIVKLVRSGSPHTSFWFLPGIVDCDTEENHGKAFKTLSPKQNFNIDPTIKESSSPTMTASLVPVCPSGFQLGSFQPGLRRAKRWRRKALPGDLLPQVRMKPSQWSEVKIVKWLSCMVRYGELWWVMFIPKIPICTSLYTSPSCSLIRISKMRVLEPRSGVEALSWRSENLEPHFL